MANAPTIGSWFNVWLRSPELADQLQKLGSHIRFKSSLPARLNEFAILITARHWTSQYEWFAHHRRIGNPTRRSGVSSTVVA